MIKLLNTIFQQREFLEVSPKDLQHIDQYQDSLSLLIITFAYLQPLKPEQFAKDEIIRAMTKIIRESIRHDDCFAHLSQEEFVIFLPFANTLGAIIVAQCLCRCISELSFIIYKNFIKPTIRIGIASSQKTEKKLTLFYNEQKKLF